MESVSIIYYSSNREHIDFEQRIIENLVSVSKDLPIISVTQKPVKLGKNICVGDVGVSGFNMFRQVQIALENTDTDYVISAEADCLYPSDYFEFIPKEKNKCYRNTNLYVMPDQRDYFFHKKEGATHSQVIGREFYLNRLKELFTNAPQWSTEEFNFPKERTGKDDIFDVIIPYTTKEPVIQIKTHKGMRYYTHSERQPIYELSYWGDGRSLKRYYCYGIT